MGPSEGLAPLHKSPEDDICPSPPLHTQPHSGSDSNPPVLEQISTTVHSSITFQSISPIAWDFQSTQQVTPPPILLYPEDVSCVKGGMTGGVQEVEDLIHLAGPLTEDAVLKTLHARFCSSHYFTNVGPILLSVNPYHEVGNALTLTSTRAAVQSPHLLRVVHEAVRQQSETGYPQAIILSGASGSGKTYTSMLLLRQLFDVAGGGPETDAFKHLAAAFTVLRSLGSVWIRAEGTLLSGPSAKGRLLPYQSHFTHRSGYDGDGECLCSVVTEVQQL